MRARPGIVRRAAFLSIPFSLPAARKAIQRQAGFGYFSFGEAKEK
jgi:hypothetical protein